MTFQTRERMESEAMTDEIGAQAPDGDVAPAVDTSDLVDGAVDRSAIATAAPIGEYLTSQQVADLYQSVSMADSWRATEQSRRTYPDDPDMAKRLAGQLVFLYAAQRVGLAAPLDTSTDDVMPQLLTFLATIRQDDFVRIMADVKGKSTAS